MKDSLNKQATSQKTKKNSIISESDYYSVGSDCSISQDAIIGKFTSIGKGVTVGKNSRIGQNVTIADGVIIGENCEIQNNVCLPEGVICGDNVLIGHSTVLTTIHYPHRITNVQSKRELMITRINNGVKIGANVTIICGLEIGMFAFIASASIITNDVRAYALIIGNPAKQTGWVSEHGSKLNFLNKDRMASCPISGFTYKLEGLSLRKLR